MSQTITDFTAENPRIDGLTETERHRLLAVERRRIALDVLAERAAPVELSALATEIAAREDGRDVSDEATVKRIKLTLHHTHLPKMESFGVVEYHADSRLVTRN